LAALGDALAALGRLSGLIPSAPVPDTPPAGLGADRDALARWIEIASATLGVEAESTSTTYGAIEKDLRNAPPALVQLPGPGAPPACPGTSWSSAARTWCSTYCGFSPGGWWGWARWRGGSTAACSWHGCCCF